MHHVAEQHELAQHHGLDDGDAPRNEFDTALSAKHRGLHHDHRAEGDVEVGADDRELLELVHGAVVQRRFRAGLGCHNGSPPMSEDPTLSWAADTVGPRALSAGWNELRQRTALSARRGT